MVTIQASYPPNGSRTAGSGFDISALQALQALIANEGRRPYAPPTRQAPAARHHYALPGVTKEGSVHPEGGFGRLQAGELEALQPGMLNRPMIGGPGVIVGPQSSKLDLNKLSAGARRLYLPQNAGMGPIGDSRASLPEGEEPAPEGSNRGWDFANPIDKSAALDALLRSNAEIAERPERRKRTMAPDQGYGGR